MLITTNLPENLNSQIKIDLKCDKCECLFKRRYDIYNKSKYKHFCKKCIDKKKDWNREKSIETRKKNNKIKYPKFTICCGICNKNFIVPYRERERIYCSRSCQVKAVNKNKKSIKKISKCKICDKEFEHYGERIFCSYTCNGLHLSQVRIGENNPAFKDKIKRKCLNCKQFFEYSRDGMHKGQTRVFCSLACSHQINLQEPVINYKNGYPVGWNRKLREIIRKRDGFLCQLCGCEQTNHKHPVHHIDYDKKNIEKNNLITLCKKCHNFTNSGRTFWEIVFNGLISGSKIVRKDWGAEIHIVNNNEYCLKYLIFYKNKQFSYHKHNLKKELWHCLHGKLECVIGNGKNKEYSIFNSGAKIQIDSGVEHQLQALKNSILVEVSTKDFPEDSIRLVNGIN